MINLPALAERLNEYGILNKSFMDMTKTEILLMVSAVFSNPDESIPPEGWSPPTIDDRGRLLIDFAAHPKYHWWTPEGQSIYETLIEINAPWEVAKKYFDSKGITQITESNYVDRSLPF
ncbi:MAG: hypothetical protein PHI31_09705 [Desulfuromonadaceae bacterium]|nr:hypothetical protein [Desulfuromonadaceae bacterium]